jgi:hypothetical protein
MGSPPAQFLSPPSIGKVFAMLLQTDDGRIISPASLAF